VEGTRRAAAQGVFFCFLFLYTQEKEGGVGRRPRHVGSAVNIAIEGIIRYLCIPTRERGNEIESERNRKSFER